MVHLLQVSVVLTAIALIVLAVLLYSQYYGTATNNISEIIEIIANDTGLSSSSGSGGGAIVSGNETGPLNNIDLPSNVQILQNTINDTRYTAILFTENLTNS